VVPAAALLRAPPAVLRQDVEPRWHRRRPPQGRALVRHRGRVSGPSRCHAVRNEM